ncbi:MAG: hypothetical protein R3A44_05480 [Caldilineaceae bacterium]
MKLAPRFRPLKLGTAEPHLGCADDADFFLSICKICAICGLNLSSFRSATYVAVVLALGLGLLFGASSLALANTDFTLPLWQDAPSATLSGLVRNADGPVAGARVRVQATENMVITGEDGALRSPVFAAGRVGDDHRLGAGTLY